MDFHTQFLILALSTVLGGAALVYIPRAVMAYVRIWTAGEVEDRAVVSGFCITILLLIAFGWSAINFINM